MKVASLSALQDPCRREHLIVANRTLKTTKHETKKDDYFLELCSFCDPTISHQFLFISLHKSDSFHCSGASTFYIDQLFLAIFGVYTLNKE